MKDEKTRVTSESFRKSVLNNSLDFFIRCRITINTYFETKIINFFTSENRFMQINN